MGEAGDPTGSGSMAAASALPTPHLGQLAWTLGVVDEWQRGGPGPLLRAQGCGSAGLPPPPGGARSSLGRPCGTSQPHAVAPGPALFISSQLSLRAHGC